MKSKITLAGLFVLFISLLTFPTYVFAKCPGVPSDLVCADLHYSFLPERPDVGEKVTVIAYWVDQRRAKPVTNARWLARKGNPAYLWLWDHKPSELENIAYITGMAGKVKPPQIIVPLRWDAEKHEYQGTFVLTKSGRWYFRLGTLVPDDLSTSLEADSDYGGPIQTIDVSAATRSLAGIVNWLVWPVLILGSGLAISIFLSFSGFSQRMGR